MIALSPEEIARTCDAELIAGASQQSGERDFPSRAAVDTRTLKSGELFLGLAGERSDGGAFASDALAGGAWGIVISPEHVQRARQAYMDSGARVFVTRSPLVALARLAHAWLGRLRVEGCRVLGITGSTGKTSTKDILLALLRPPLDGRVHASRENFNTEIGLPLTVLETELGTKALVLEMAMRGIGQIRLLAEIARPEVGIITNVGPVHLELVGTIERVAEAKAELIGALPSGGACVVPAGEEALHPHLRSDTRVITFAQWCPGPASDPLARTEQVASASADVRALSVERTASGLDAEIVVGAERARFRLNFTQAHNLVNALAAIGAGHVLGVSLEALAEGAASVRFSKMRGEEVELQDDMLVINDCYNANPVSMHAALDHLVRLASARGAPRSVAVLGDMRELGKDEARFHCEIGRYAASIGVDLLVAVGERTSSYADGFGAAGKLEQLPDAPAAAVLVPDLVRPRDVILIKGSRSLELELVAEALQAMPEHAGEAS